MDEKRKIMKMSHNEIATLPLVLAGAWAGVKRMKSISIQRSASEENEITITANALTVTKKNRVREKAANNWNNKTFALLHGYQL